MRSAKRGIQWHRSSVHLTGACLAIAAGAVGGPCAMAQPRTWRGGAGSWQDNANWINAGPNDVGNVAIDGGNPTGSVVTIQRAQTAQNLTIDVGDTLRLSENGALRIGKTITVNGILDLNPGTNSGGQFLNFSQFGVGNNYQMNGTGEVQFGESSEITTPPRDTLRLGAGLTLRSVGLGQTRITGRVINEAIVSASQPNPGSYSSSIVFYDSVINRGTMSATNRGFISLGGGFTNDSTGVLKVSGKGSAGFSGATLNQGLMRADGLSVLSIYGRMTNTGSIQLTGEAVLVFFNGYLSSPAGLNLPEGRIVGNGTINTNLQIGDRISPGFGTAPRGTTDRFDILGNFTLSGGSHYQADIAGTGTANADLLAITGDLDLSSGNGSLDVNPLSPILAGQRFVVASYTGQLTGTFDHVTSGFAVSYDVPGEVAVIVVPEPTTLIFAAGAGGLLMLRRTRRRAQSLPHIPGIDPA